MTPQEFGQKIATELREHPNHWTQGAASRDIHGAGSDLVLPNACQWCLGGFIHRDVPALTARYRIYVALENILQSRGIVDYNDDPTRTVDDIIGVMDKLAEK